MKIKFVGESDVSFEHGSVYEAKEISDSMGSGFIVKDESGEWYRYGRDYIRDNFDITASLLQKASHMAKKVAL